MEGLDKIDNPERKEKPEVLYHASKTSGIKEFVPNRGNFRDEDEGAVIFSTPDKVWASMFLVEGHNDDYTLMGSYRGTQVDIIRADRDEFIKKDNGGVMYTFPSDTFDFDPDKGMGEKEWTSRESVKPTSETRYPSALDAMIENEVQVYFVDQKTFDAIKSTEDEFFGILVGLNSENEDRGESFNPMKDFRGDDLSKRNLSKILIDVLMQVNFDSQTIWPTSENLPEGFDPKKVLEQGMNPGLGLQELHNQGVNGEGINVAIIDQKLDPNHKEYSGSIVDYQEIGPSGKEMSMHGPAVASLFVGKNCGVAPEAKLHFYAAPCGSNARWEYYSEALNNIIDHNVKADDKDKIKVVSCSFGRKDGDKKGDFAGWLKTIKKAQEIGIIFIDAENIFDMNFTGGGGYADKEDSDQYHSWNTGKGDSFFSEGKTIVPSDFRTIASSWNKKDKDGADEYFFNGQGGISWSIPYLAGIFSLMLQIKSDLKMDEMVKIAQDTAVVNKAGLKVINPSGIIESVKTL